MDTRFNRRRIANYRWEIQRNISRFSPMGFVFWRFREARRLLDAHKELILPPLFIVLEAVSVVLDQIAKNKVAILLVAFLLSAFGFAISLYSFIRFYCSIKKARTGEINMDQMQLKVVDIVYSVIQLIATFIQFSLAVFKVKNNYNATVFPLASAMISVVFIFIKHRNITDSSPTLPITNPIQIDGSSTTAPLLGPTPIEEAAESSTTAPLLGSTPIEEAAESSTTAPLLGSTPIEEPESSPTDPPLGSTPIEPDSSTTDLPLGSTPIEPDSSPIDSLLGSTPIESDSSTTDSPIENLQPIGSMTRIPIELDQIGTSTNQVNPARISTVRRRTHAHKQIKTSTSQVNPPGSSTTVKRRTRTHPSHVSTRNEEPESSPADILFEAMMQVNATYFSFLTFRASAPAHIEIPEGDKNKVKPNYTPPPKFISPKVGLLKRKNFKLRM